MRGMAAYEEGACKGTVDSCCGEEGGGWWIHVSLGAQLVIEGGWSGAGRAIWRSYCLSKSERIMIEAVRECLVYHVGRVKNTLKFLVSKVQTSLESYPCPC